MWNCSLNFLFTLFMCRNSLFLCVDLVSCNFPKYVHWFRHSKFLLWRDKELRSIHSHDSSNSFCCGVVRVFYIWNHITCKQRNFASLPTFMPFISFSYLTVLAEISGTMLNRNGESGHPCLVPNPRRKAFRLSPLCMMLVVSYMKHGFHTWLTGTTWVWTVWVDLCVPFLQ